MTLGTAARSSIANVRASEIRGGASSARKIAPPTPRGTAMSKQTAEVTTVPYMNGKAPKFSKTGSQVEVTKNHHPNLCRGSAELRYSS